MNVACKNKEVKLEEMDDDSDSFHSLNESRDLDDPLVSKIEEQRDTGNLDSSMEINLSTKCPDGAANLSYSSESEQEYLFKKKDNIVSARAYRSRYQSIASKSANKSNDQSIGCIDSESRSQDIYELLMLDHPRKRWMDNYKVPELSVNSPLKPEAFDLNNSDQVLSVNSPIKPEAFDLNNPDQEGKTEAMQKYAFTEIWVNSMQQKRKSIGEFSSAIESYFNKENTDELAKLSFKDKEKSAENKEVSAADPSETTAYPSSSHTAVDTEPYISPFEDFIPILQDDKLQSKKRLITVPAGYDLTNLLQYKNPNHWHLRRTTREDSSP